VVSVPAAQGALKAGQLRAIGVMGKSRVASLPDVPTIAEQGFPEVDIAGWFAVVGPPRLPAATVRRMHDAVVAAFDMPETREAMARQDNVVQPMSPEASLQFFKTEQARYARLVKQAGVEAE
jgi:tripartite-type tricarboxylate transporter receptor subunit TctC